MDDISRPLQLSSPYGRQGVRNRFDQSSAASFGPPDPLDAVEEKAVISEDEKRHRLTSPHQGQIEGRNIGGPAAKEGLFLGNVSVRGEDPFETLPGDVIRFLQIGMCDGGEIELGQAVKRHSQAWRQWVDGRTPVMVEQGFEFPIHDTIKTLTSQHGFDPPHQGEDLDNAIHGA